MNAPVSVIIPCYRCGHTIVRALSSVATQTWRPAEVIIVDDGSNDNTPEVLRRIRLLYGEDWVALIRLPRNQGPGAARNIGWHASSQPYIAFLDADDTWHPRKIEIQMKYMQNHPEVAITGHGSRELREGSIVPPLPERYTIKSVTCRRMLISNCFATPTVMLKRGLDVRFDPAKRYSEDYLLWLKIICSRYKASFIDLDLAYLHKAPYGASGLSGHLWEMEKGELDTYVRLFDEGLISWPTIMGLTVFSLAKYALRLILSVFSIRKKPRKGADL